MSDFSIFSVLGIEIEYMLVDKDTLEVQPKSDVILRTLAGKQVNEVVMGDITMSNELVMHVLELKNSAPKTPDTPVTEHFQQAIRNLSQLLAQHNLILLPTGAHPWMDPHRETVRWPHDYNEIYQQFDAIFDCKGHGWSNLQSMHVNLPYGNEDEFGQLHNLIRLILPLLPAIAASSPFLDGKNTGMLDSRLHYYVHNQERIPSISGAVIPEFIGSEAEYQDKILQPMYRDISPFDPQGILQHQWLNSRAAIPKFDLKAIEIRIIDSQECVEADIAIAKATQAILKKWHHTSDYYLKHPCDTQALRAVFDETVLRGADTRIDSRELLTQWQLPTRSMTVNEIWSLLLEQVSTDLSHKQQCALELILSQGNLSQRILRAAGKNYDRNALKQIYRQLAYCLITNQQFAA